MPTKTKVVILMHPYESRRIKANTGRLTHLCLPDSELYVGESFDKHEEVQTLISDPANYPVLLYPGADALNLSAVTDLQLATFNSQLRERRLVVFVLDATWRLVRPMLRTSLSLQRLPRIMFTNAAPSRYVIKRQPEPGCLATLEAVHELLLVLDRCGLEQYTRPDQLLDLFQRMQEFQIRRTEENHRLGRRRHALRDQPKRPSPGQSAGPKRRRIFPVKSPGPAPG